MALLTVACGAVASPTATQPAGSISTGASSPGSSADATSPTAFASPSIASPSGQLVVPWDPTGSGQQFKLYLVDASGAPPRRLTPDDSPITGSETEPAWSPDGVRLVFVGYVGDGVDLFEINADGTGLTNLTNDPGHHIEPAWSPDGAEIAYVESNTGHFAINVIAADGTRQRSLTDDLAGDDAFPEWSPDGRQLAFMHHFPGVQVPIDDFGDSAATPESDVDATQTATSYVPAALMVMNADGSGLRTLAILSGFNDRPQWSPDGALIAFTDGWPPNEQALVVGSAGSGLRTLVTGSAHSSLPRWTPDGRQLSVVVTDPGGSQAQIVLLNADGSTAHALSDIFGWQAWSPDGTRLAVLQQLLTTDGSDTGQTNMYLVATDGSPPRIVLEHATVSQAPAWRPQGP